MLKDTKLVAWGHKDNGVDPDRVTTAFHGVDTIYSTDSAFAVLFTQEAASYEDGGLKKK